MQELDRITLLWEELWATNLTRVCRDLRRRVHKFVAEVQGLGAGAVQVRWWGWVGWGVAGAGAGGGGGGGGGGCGGWGGGMRGV